MVKDCLAAHKDYHCFISLNQRELFGIGDARSVSSLSFIVFDFDTLSSKQRTEEIFWSFKEKFCEKWGLEETNYFLVDSGFGFHFALCIDLPAEVSPQLHEWGLRETEEWAKEREVQIDVLCDPARVIRAAGTLNEGKEVRLLQYPEILNPFPLKFDQAKERQVSETPRFEILNSIDPRNINWRRSVLSPCLVPLTGNKGSHRIRLLSGIELVKLFDLDPRILASLYLPFDDFDLEKTVFYLNDLKERSYALPACSSKRLAKRRFSIAQCPCDRGRYFWYSIDCPQCSNFSINKTEIKCLAIRKYGFCYPE